MREECIVLKATLAARETELSRARKAPGFEFAAQQPEENENWTPGEFRRNSMTEAERQRRTKRRLVIAGSLAAAIAACALAFHAQVEELIGKAVQLAQPQEIAPATPPAPPPVSAVIIRTATVRVAPLGTAKVTLTLPRGSEVAQLEQLGTWSYVQFKRKGATAEQQEGWVETSFLKQEKPALEAK